ncbi:hypothetical protein C8R45DRAFT_1107213 [Mycena sanguinolenta]|nr:hypothetical protein C8R45DRAFT_1107213 [Mycena sanguinolenta]
MTAAPQVVPHWNWGVPGVVIAPPRSRTLAHAPRPIDQLGFDPTSRYDLRRHIGAYAGEPGCYMTSRANFDNSDLAFLVTGASNDGQHIIGDRFFPELLELHESTVQGPTGNADRKTFIDEGRKLIYDIATKIDRATGSTTLVLMMDGTTAPGTPARPEYLRAHAHLSPSFIDDNPSSRYHVAHIAQLFIEHIGVPTVTAWGRRARVLWPRLPDGRADTISKASTPYTPLFPSPTPPNSTHYVFCGREAGWCPSKSDPDPVSQDRVYDIDEILMESILADLETAHERVSTLQVSLNAAEDKIEALQSENNRLKQENRRLCASQENGQLQASQGITSPPSTPSRSCTALSTPSRLRPMSPRVPSMPPPYTELGSNPSTPRGATPHRQAPTPRQAAPFTLGLVAHQFLIDADLEAHVDAIRLICRFVSPLRWAAEVEELQCLPESVRAPLIAALEADLATSR